MSEVEVKDYIEHEDGSATIVFDCDFETRQLLVAQGLLKILDNTIERLEDGEDV